MFHLKAAPSQKDTIPGDEKRSGGQHAYTLFEKVTALKIGWRHRPRRKKQTSPTEKVTAQEHKGQTCRAKDPDGGDQKETTDNPRVRPVEMQTSYGTPGKREKHEEEERGCQPGQESLLPLILDPATEVIPDAREEKKLYKKVENKKKEKDNKGSRKIHRKQVIYSIERELTTLRDQIGEKTVGKTGGG